MYILSESPELVIGLGLLESISLLVLRILAVLFTWPQVLPASSCPSLFCGDSPPGQEMTCARLFLVLGSAISKAGVCEPHLSCTLCLLLQFGTEAVSPFSSFIKHPTLTFAGYLLLLSSLDCVYHKYVRMLPYSYFLRVRGLWRE